MWTWKRFFRASFAATGVVALAASVAGAADPTVTCQASLLKVTGKYAYCRLKADSKAAKALSSPDYAKCDMKFMESWAKAIIKGGDACRERRQSSSGQWFQSAITDATARVNESLAIGGAPSDENVPYCKLPATGQTTSYQSGDDGDVQAGSTLGYVSVGNVSRGTTGYGGNQYVNAILDQRTGLMWESKHDGGGVRDVDNMYCWDPVYCPGNSVWDHVAELNNRCWWDDTVSCTTDDDCAAAGAPICGYVGFRDWRVPNVKELMSIVNYENVAPAVDTVFNDHSADLNDCETGCLNCSCTAANDYWSSTTYAYSQDLAWGVGFSSGSVSAAGKYDFFYVRAVRGGS